MLKSDLYAAVAVSVLGLIAASGLPAAAHVNGECTRAQQRAPNTRSRRDGIKQRRLPDLDPAAA